MKIKRPLSPASRPRRDDPESRRLAEDATRQRNWKRWGPYLAERQWGTVREDYSADGKAWEYFPHAHARSRAYRWGEDGLLGITDRQCRLCFGLALWNGRDPILKERLFGLGGPEGNHGEDVKECYYYLDSTPTHSYMKALYKYPQREFPYERLREESLRRGRDAPELELEDTGVFEEGRYFDVFAEYAKGGPNDLLIRITVINRGPEPAACHVLPQLWFRNTWSFKARHEGSLLRPGIERQDRRKVFAWHETLGRYLFEIGPGPAGEEAELLFTDNVTNFNRLYGVDNPGPWVRDAFHDHVIDGRRDVVNPAGVGTRMAAHFDLDLEPGRPVVLRFRLSDVMEPGSGLEEGFEPLFARRRLEADEYYDALAPDGLADEERRVMRQAHAGLLWSKQFYHYVVDDWIRGDPVGPPPPPERKEGRNQDWQHLYSRDVISMPDKWEYPWFAAWDLAFHMIPFAEIDPEFAKKQLTMLLREWYMHPNGQIPAYEYDFSDVNPPVHAWAAWRVYKMTAPRGERDRAFLSGVFQKLLLNFTWWVNRKDPTGRHVFSGGFLGLDNIGVFDRSRPLPTGGVLEQADGTAWMASYCSTMLSMALDLARDRPAAEDMASKFFEHFVAIADAMNNLDDTGLWDEEDGFYYDRLRIEGRSVPLRVRSLVGAIPLIAVEVLEESDLEFLGGFRKRLDWFLEHRHDLARQISYMERDPQGKRRLLAIPSRERLLAVLRRLLDENEFLSPYGLRALSKAHAEDPYEFHAGGRPYRVRYLPGESDSGMFGGNSNWRGPVWFPLNYLLIEALERYHHFYGDSLQVEFPTGSGHLCNLRDVACNLASRLSRLFLRGVDGRRPAHGPSRLYRDDPHFRDLVLFYEYFHGDDGRGLGASHQTGWTALVTRCLTKRLRADER